MNKKEQKFSQNFFCLVLTYSWLWLVFAGLKILNVFNTPVKKIGITFSFLVRGS